MVKSLQIYDPKLIRLLMMNVSRPPFAPLRDIVNEMGVSKLYDANTAFWGKDVSKQATRWGLTIQKQLYGSEGLTRNWYPEEALRVIVYTIMVDTNPWG